MRSRSSFGADGSGWSSFSLQKLCAALMIVTFHELVLLNPPAAMAIGTSVSPIAISIRSTSSMSVAILFSALYAPVSMSTAPIRIEISRTE